MEERFIYPLPACLLVGEIMERAKRCESSNHWAMAAILWHRVGDKEAAESCEEILYNFAIGVILFGEVQHDF